MKISILRKKIKEIASILKLQIDVLYISYTDETGNIFSKNLKDGSRTKAFICFVGNRWISIPVSFKESQIKESFNNFKRRFKDKNEIIPE